MLARLHRHMASMPFFGCGVCEGKPLRRFTTKPQGNVMYFFQRHHSPQSNMLKAVCFEEKIYREVEKVEEGSRKREVRAKTFLTSSTLR
jgi:hypothetical protein